MILLFFTISIFAISANAVPPLISKMAESTGIAVSNFGVFIFIQFIAFSLAAFAGGYIKDKFKISNYFLISAGLAIIVICLALGAVFLNSYISLIIWVIPLGFSGGAVETFSSIQISNLSRRGSSKNICLSQVFFSIGALSAPQIVYLCLGIGLNWNTIFFIFAVLSALVMILFLGLNKHKLYQKSATEDSRNKSEIDADLVQKKRGLFLIFLLTMIFYVIFESLSTTWLSYIFEQRFFLTSRDAALTLVVFWAGMIIGRFSITLIPSRLTLWPALLTSSFIITISAIILTTSKSLPIAISSVFLLGISAGPVWPVLVMISLSVFRSEKRTAILIGTGAIGFAIGQLIGSVLIRFESIQIFHQAQLYFSVIVLLFVYAAFFLNRFKYQFK